MGSGRRPIAVGPAPRLAVALKLCSSQKSTGEQSVLDRPAGFCAEKLGLHQEQWESHWMRGGRGSACPGLPIPAPGPHAHFLGILVGFPQALESGPHTFSILLHPWFPQGAEHIPKTRISMANMDNQWPGPRELSLMPPVIGERPGSAPGADTPHGFSQPALRKGATKSCRGRRGRRWSWRSWKGGGKKKKSLLTCNQGP